MTSQILEHRYKAKTIEGQLNLMLKSIGDVSNKLQEARKNGYAHLVLQYKEMLRTQIDEYQELRVAAGFTPGVYLSKPLIKETK